MVSFYGNIVHYTYESLQADLRLISFLSSILPLAAQEILLCIRNRILQKRKQKHLLHIVSIQTPSVCGSAQCHECMVAMLLRQLFEYHYIISAIIIVVVVTHVDAPPYLNDDHKTYQEQSLNGSVGEDGANAWLVKPEDVFCVEPADIC